MKTITAIVDGTINKELDFIQQEDGWYFNEEHNLSIDPLLNSCIIESNSDAYILPLEAPSFKVLNAEEILLDVFINMSQGKPLSAEFNKILSDNIFDLF